MRASCIALIAASALLATSTARADEREASGVAYGIATFDYAGAAAVLIETGAFDRANEVRLAIWSLAVPAVALTVGLLAYEGGWEPRVGHALHGAFMMGMDLFLLGALIDGTGEDGGALQIGPWAITLGLLGGILGTLAGALLVQDDDAWIWAATPWGGALAGAITAIAWTLASFTFSSERLWEQGSIVSIVTFTAAGLALATIGAGIL